MWLAFILDRNSRNLTVKGFNSKETAKNYIYDRAEAKELKRASCTTNKLYEMLMKMKGEKK